MTFDPSKPVRTRDGRKARIICTNVVDPPYPIIALIEDPEDGLESVETYTIGGHIWDAKEAKPDGKDLVNVPEQDVRYMNVYFSFSQPSYLHRTKTLANENKIPATPRAALLELTFEGRVLKSVKIEKDEL